MTNNHTEPMKVGEAIAAMRNLGVSLNDYDSEALEVLIEFARDRLSAEPSPAEVGSEDTKDTISKLQSFLDRVIHHSETGIIHPELYEADCDTLRMAIFKLRHADRALNQRLAVKEGEADESAAETAWSVAGRLALELECLLLDTKDMAVVSKWWDTAHEALEEYRLLRNAAPCDCGQFIFDRCQALKQVNPNIGCKADIQFRYKTPAALSAKQGEV